MDFESLINIDVRTLISVLFWHNLIVIVNNLVYSFTVGSKSKSEFFKVYTTAKMFQAAAFFMLFYRDFLLGFITVNIGNSLLFLGFFYESLSIYEILEIKSKKNTMWLVRMLCYSLFVFNVIEFIDPLPNIRVASASLSVFAILIIPSVTLLFSKKSNSYKRASGFFYLFFTLLMLPRIFSMLTNEQASLFTNNIVQSLTFLSLIMVNTLSSSTFFIQMKDNVDKATIRLSRIDYLTSLPNRYYFFKLAENTFAAYKSNQLPLAVLLLDLDRLKYVNDKYGISFGDKVLVAFSDIIQANLGDKDIVCRYSGGEMLAVMPNSNVSDGFTAAQKILDEVHAIRFEEFPDFIFTVSIGIVSGHPCETDMFFKYIEEADKLLFRAKSKGGDRIEFRSLDDHTNTI